MTTPESSENRETVGSGTAESVAAKPSHSERAIQIGLVALANGVELDPLRYIDLLDRAKRRDEWEAEHGEA